MPSCYKGKVTKEEWRFAKQMVASCAQSDTRRFKSAKLTNEQIHRRATEVIDEVLRRGLLKPGGVDDMGGCGPLLLQPHALMKLSLDRKDDTKPHFTPGRQALHNLQLVPYGINTHRKIPNVRAGVEAAKARTTPTPYGACAKASVGGIWRRKRKGDHKRKDEYSDLKCHAEFETLEDFKGWVERLYREQGGRCAITDVPFGTGPGTWEQPSLDAINPRLGHVPGNLRWICAGFNSGNYDAKKTYDALDDAPTLWTR